MTEDSSIDPILEELTIQKGSIPQSSSVSDGPRSPKRTEEEKQDWGGGKIEIG